MTPIRTGALVALAIALAACASDAPTASDAVTVDAPLAAAKAENPSSFNKDVAAVRAATARYHRVEVAEADGYAPASPCVAIPGAAMGIHYLNFALLMDGQLDPEKPEALVYEPQADGSLKLVAAEYLIPASMWTAQHGATRPELFGRTFEDGPMGTYALHAWVWRNNPWGMFAAFNPTASCPTDAPAVAGAHAGH